MGISFFIVKIILNFINSYRIIFYCIYLNHLEKWFNIYWKKKNDGNIEESSQDSRQTNLKYKNDFSFCKIDFSFRKILHLNKIRLFKYKIVIVIRLETVND